jgi:hypothetical protein
MDRERRGSAFYVRDLEEKIRTGTEFSNGK